MYLLHIQCRRYHSTRPCMVNPIVCSANSSCLWCTTRCTIDCRRKRRLYTRKKTFWHPCYHALTRSAHNSTRTSSNLCRLSKRLSMVRDPVGIPWDPVGIDCLIAVLLHPRVPCSSIAVYCWYPHLPRSKTVCRLHCTAKLLKVQQEDPPAHPHSPLIRVVCNSSTKTSLMRVVCTLDWL